MIKLKNFKDPHFKDPKAVKLWLKAIQGWAGLHKKIEAGDEDCLEFLRDMAQNCLGSLQHFAEKGNGQAAEFLHLELGRALLCFDRLGHKKPELLKPIAQQCDVWPGFVALHKDNQKQTDLLIKKIGLGTCAMFNHSGKTWTRETPEVKVALRLLRGFWFRENGCPDNKFDKLKPLSRENYSVWWSALKPLLTEFYGRDFEDNKIFSDYWENATYRGENNKRALIRRDIQKKIKQALRSLAPRV